MNMTCRKCGHQHAGVGAPATECPACGAVYAKVEALAAQGGKIRRRGVAEEFDDELRAKARTSEAAATTSRAIMQVAAGGFILAAAALMLWPKAKDADAQAHERERLQEGQALSRCVDAMRALAKDPASADIPSVPARRLNNTYAFEWGRSTMLMRMRNGLGLEVPAEGACVIESTSLQVISANIAGL
jgi:predicted  nucleic acid-binding Zn-ribbon protein